MSKKNRLKRWRQEVDRLTKEVASLQSLSKRQEQALAKKDKQLQDNTEEINEMRRIHEQIFNLSKLKSNKWKLEKFFHRFSTKKKKKFKVEYYLILRDSQL